VVALRRGAPPEEVQRVILEQGHSRMPVYDGSIDNIVGYVVAATSSPWPGSTA